MKRTVVIVGGGKGLRMGSELPKQFIPLQGKPILMHTLDVFYQCDSSIDIVLVLPEAHISYWEMLCRELKFTIPHRIVHGGETRFHSVRNGLLSLASASKELIAVHDGVRPFVRPEVITACFEKAETYGAAIPVIPMNETVRIVQGSENQTLDRTQLCVVQTPQVFRSDILLAAYRQPFEERFTDDASVVEASGHPIILVAGNQENIKITSPVDIQFAEFIYASSHQREN